MSAFFGYYLFLICVVISQQAEVFTENELQRIRSNEFSVIGYVPEWRFDSVSFESIIPKVTHLILFSIETDDKGNLVEVNRLPAMSKMKQIRALTKKYGTNLMISFGGFGRENGFFNMARNDNLRDTFCDNVIQFVDEYNIDGIDFGEYPHSDEEWFGLFQIINELKLKMPNIIITMAFYPGQEEIFHSNEALNDFKVHDNVDLFSMMAYDNIQKGKLSKHSTFEFAVKSIDNAINNGIPSHKLVLGLPFYGRHQLNGDWKTYQEIIDELMKLEMNGLKGRIKDINEWDEFYYNGYSMIVKKTMYALNAKIGGVMIWECGQDTNLESFSLLNAIRGAVDEYLKTHHEL